VVAEAIRHNGQAMADPLATLADLLAPAFGALDPEGPAPDAVVRPSDRADAQANGALPLAKRLGRSPRDVAEEVLAAALPALTGVAGAEIAGPGFLNVTFDDAFLAAEIAAVAADARLGVPTAPDPRRIVIDYSAPNVAKEMHVGHLRSTVIGDALARLEMHLGHTVIRENHIGDWGTPFGMLIEHLLDLGETEAAEELSLGDLDAFYKQGRAKFDASPAFQERARQRVVLLQSGDAETRRLWQLLVDLSTQHFNAAYRKLGVLLTDDDLAGESTYNHLLPEVIERLRDKGLLEVSEGADVVFPPGFTNRDGDPLPLIVQKRTGGFNYGTSDLACVIDRVERLHADVMLYVVGAPQAQHLAMVFEVARMAGWLQPPAEAVHVAFGNVLGADKKILKSRSGETVKLSELLDEAVQRAAAVVAAKSPDLPAQERASVADAVGIGAIKYADLSSDRIRDYVFDFDRMLSLDGNTAPYLQYAHARICSLFRRAEVDRGAVRDTVPTLGEPAERALALRLLAYPTAVAATAERYALHTLCGYLYDLASDFTTFYEQCPVLRAPDEQTRTSRLALADLTARVLRDGLGLLGIDTPERM
jgi:arginyl-tRNA synthetase